MVKDYDDIVQYCQSKLDARLAEGWAQPGGYFFEVNLRGIRAAVLQERLIKPPDVSLKIHGPNATNTVYLFEWERINLSNNQ